MDDLIANYHSDLNPKVFSSCDDQTPGSNNCLDCFKRQYYDGNEIGYDCVEKRKLYLLRYFPAHKAENYQGAFRISDDVIDDWMGHGYIDILSVGGGPGSDICGVLEYLEEEAEKREIELSVNVIRIDIEDQWDDVFEDVMQRFFPWANCQTIHRDVNKGLDSISDERFDLVIASYLTSELSTKQCMNLANKIDSVLTDGGVLMINDRPEDVVEKDIRSMFQSIELSYEEYFLSGWAGYSYPNDIANAVGPKFRMNSRMFVGVKE
ncbi:hypothetical protein FEV13_15680 [Stutzerimonas degradans]|nr:hypothetical protein FEV13_15680 [Stutzerimonas degradans]